MLEMNTGTVDLNLMRVFLAIWETHSLTLAADRLALSQPAVSHCLKRLRDVFQDPLFVRTAEGRQPTGAAVRRHEPIDRALDLIYGAMQRHAGYDPATSTRRFRISMSESGFDLVPGEHPIVPIMLGDAALAARFADAMLAQGVYVIGFSYPVVPQGKARIRTQISAAHTTEELETAVTAFCNVKQELGV